MLPNFSPIGQAVDVCKKMHDFINYALTSFLIWCYNKNPPRESKYAEWRGRGRIRRTPKQIEILKKVLTQKRSHGKITELRLEKTKQEAP